MADNLLVQIASYNTNLQAHYGNEGLPQDLVDWLSPTLTVSSFLSRGQQAPDIVAVGFQELLPLHFGREWHCCSRLKLQTYISTMQSLVSRSRS